MKTWQGHYLSPRQGPLPLHLSSDTLNPLEGDKLLSIGGSMTIFPQEPHSQVGGCTHNLTQTTQVQTSKSGSPCGPCPGLLLRAISFDWTWFFIPCPTLAGTVRRYVGATSHRLWSCANTRGEVSRLFKPSVSVCGRSRPTGLYRTYERDHAVYAV